MADEDKNINDACDAIECNYDIQIISGLLQKIDLRGRTVWQKNRNPLICAVATNRCQMVIFYNYFHVANCLPICHDFAKKYFIMILMFYCSILSFRNLCILNL